MKYLLIFLLLLLDLHFGQAQNAVIDSLSVLIKKTKSDTARINLSNILISNISEVNLDSAIVLGKKIIGESRIIHYKKGEAAALRTLSTNLLMKGEFDEAESRLKEAGTIVLASKDSTGIAALFGTYGMYYGMQSKYDSAGVYFEKAIGIAERNGYKKMLRSYYGNIGIGYQMQSKFAQALIYQQKSLKLAEEGNDINQQAYTKMNMGNTYLKMGDTLRSEKVLLNGIELARKVGIKNVEIYGYTNLASLYTMMNKWDDAYTYAMKAAILARETGDIPIEAASYSKAAVAIANLKKYGEATEVIKKGMGLADASGQPIIISQLNSGMGTILRLQGKYSEAIPYFEKSIQAFKDADQFDDSTSDIYSDLSICYEKTGDYEKALSNFKNYSTIRDSIRTKENIQKATELSMNYEFEKKEQAQQIEQKNKDKAAGSRQMALSIGLGLTLILAFVAYRALRIKQKGNALLQIQKEKIQSTLTKLEKTQAQLIQAEKMASLGELTAGIAHEIQNPLNFVNNFSEVNKELIAEMKDEIEKGNYSEAVALANDVVDNEDKILHHGKRADAIVKGMLQHSRTGSGQKEPTHLNALCDEYLRLAYHGLRARDKTFNATMKTDFDERIGNINIVPQDMGRVILNLITNAFYAVTDKKKQGPGTYEPTVTVITKKTKEGITISVQDNGNGIPKKVQDKVFQPFFTTKPTGEGTGLGLSLSYDIVKAHGGELKVETEVGVGTEFIIRLGGI